jgi:cytochrome P450
MRDEAVVDRLVADFDSHDPRFDPEVAGEVYRRLRAERPVGRSRAHGGVWVLSRYRDVRDALREHETFLSGEGVFFPRAPGTPFFAPLEMDPPVHTVHRELMRPPFIPAAVRRLEPRVQRAVADLLDPVVRRGAGDLIAELAVPLPLTVLSLALGFSAETRDQIRECTSRTWRLMPTAGDAEGFWPQFVALFAGEIARARRADDGGYLSWLVRQEMDGRPLTDDDLSVIVVPLSIAGHETTMNAASQLLLHLSRDPHLQRRLRDEPEIAESVIDEALRMYTSVDHGTRVTSRDVIVDGVTIPAGSRVVLIAGSANRDADEFDRPDEFRLDRGPARHLSFGHGIHFCLGAQLAKLQLGAILRELARHPVFAPTAPSHRFYDNGRHMHVDRLPVRFAE